MKVLVTGGAGYIGSETVALLLQTGHEVVVLDSLEQGHRQALSDDVTLVEGRIDDQAIVERVLAEHAFDGVVHWCAIVEPNEHRDRP